MAMRCKSRLSDEAGVARIPSGPEGEHLHYEAGYMTATYLYAQEI